MKTLQTQRVYRRGGWVWQLIALVLLGLLPAITFAQPANNDCANATVVNFTPNEFAIGVFDSPQSNLTGATRQFGEPFHSIQVSSGNDKKTVWYRFSLPTARGVRIELLQPASNVPQIPQADVGFTVFKTNSCMPTLADVEPAKLTPLNKFGNSFNPCLNPGTYYIQVSAKDNAFTNMPIYLQITLSIPNTHSTISAPYDLRTEAYQFNGGSAISGDTPWMTYEVGCQTIDNGTDERCTALGADNADFTQTTWFTFRTDNHVDFLRFELRNQATGAYRVGYRLYRGDVRTTTYVGMPIEEDCRVLSNTLNQIDYYCQLLPNTTYSIQLFYHKDFVATFDTRIREIGVAPTIAPQASTVPAVHRLGVLPSSGGGTWTNRTDWWACNARMSINQCPTVINVNSFNQVISGVNRVYDMVDWVTFELSSFSNVYFENTSEGCALPLVTRIYHVPPGLTQDVTNTCNQTLLADFVTSNTINCMPAGKYSMAVFGVSGSNDIFNCGASHMARRINIAIRVSTASQFNDFSLRQTTNINRINNNNPLPNGATVYSTADQFACGRTVLPTGANCSANITKVIYRTFVIGDSDGDGQPDNGILTVGGGNWNFSYRIYQGDAATLVTTSGLGAPPYQYHASNVITGLVDMAGCFGAGGTSVCLMPGTYTLVTFGNDNHVSIGDQPWVRFVKYDTKFDLSANGRVNRVNNGNPLVSGITYTTTLDEFDCIPSVLPDGNVCGAFDRGIYRTFRINGYGVVNIVGNCGRTYRLYQGDANALAVSQNKFSFPERIMGLPADGPCFNGYCWNWCGPGYLGPNGYYDRICVTPGWYTLVSFGNASTIGQTDQPTIRFTALHNMFSLTNTPASATPANQRVDLVNSPGGVWTPLAPGQTVSATANHFDCYPTVLPQGLLCSPDGVTVDRAMYRQVRINQNGFLTVSRGSCPSTCWPGLGYRLFRGDAQALALAQNVTNAGQTITGLVDQGGCNCSQSSFRVCVTPGVYTLVTYGHADMRTFSDQPSFTFNVYENQFDLDANTRVDLINSPGGVWTPIPDGGSASAASNPFDCDVTVLPNNNHCGAHDRAMYRMFRVTTSGILSVGGGNSNHVTSLYSGNARDLAQAQGILNNPAGRINGLTEVPNAACRSLASWGGNPAYSVCLTPGDYTLVTYGNFDDIGNYDSYWLNYIFVTTKYDDPTASPARVDRMGNANAGRTGDPDLFSCLDNPRTIDGKAPCNGATKLIYREFELTQPSHVTISGSWGVHTLFKNWASDPGGFANLQFFSETPASHTWYGNNSTSGDQAWDCFSMQSTRNCNKLPVGKYTVVSYGDINLLNRPNNVTISINPELPAPKYNTPATAYDAGITDYNLAQDGAAYPNTKKDYTFDFERFNCMRDLPNSIINGCAPSPAGPPPSMDGPPYQPGIFNRTAYFVFTVTRESYIRIRNIPHTYRAQVFNLNARTAPPGAFTTATPIQDCIVRHDINYWCYWQWTWVGEIELCRVQPGTYTLVVYATDDHIGQTVQPILTVEKQEASRFDNARQAYDFGVIPGDNVNYLGKPNTTNPLHSGRAPSNDFFNCRTGARRQDPGRNTPYYTRPRADNNGACWIGGYPVYPPLNSDTTSVPYPMPTNYAVYHDPTQLDSTVGPIRRNLWYTFVAQGGGTITINVYNRTASETNQNPYTVYVSDVDGTLDFQTQVATAGAGSPNAVDSIMTQGLTKIVSNNYTDWWGCCYNQQAVSFTRDVCDVPKRYYIVVDHHFFNELNNQVEVGIRYNQLPTPSLRYDLVTQANHIDGTGQNAEGLLNGGALTPIATNGLRNGLYTGAVGRFPCHTYTASTDQATCSPPGSTRSIWYAFDVSLPGRIRVNYLLNPGGSQYNANNIALYRKIGAADDFSTTGLQRQTLTTVFDNGQNWGEVCSQPGRYYIQLNGCGFTDDAMTITPQVWLTGRSLRYNNFSNANLVNGLNQGAGKIFGQPMFNPLTTAYTPVVLTNGNYIGDTATFACATRENPSDGQTPCGPRTLWYAIDIGATGRLRINYEILGLGQLNNTDNIELYRELIPGDSTAAGLQKLTLQTMTISNVQWAQSCMRPGRYYIKLTGCWYTNENVVPRFWLIEDFGDFCTRPVEMTLVGAGSVTSINTTVDCHTIGEAFGENGSNMGCLFGPANYKSTWFKLNMISPEKVDITFKLTENTTAFPQDIRYRVMYGNCTGMTAGPCNSNALTEFTLNCMKESVYWVQVVTPVNATGTINMNISTVITPDQTCIPLEPLKPVANFTVVASCEGQPVQFNNMSSLGPDIIYFWNFGHAGATSTAMNPTYTYPVTGGTANYNVTLTVTNTANGMSDMVSFPVTVYSPPGGAITRAAPNDGPTVVGGSGVNFFANPTNVITDPPTMFAWDFGTNATPRYSTLQNPTGIVFANIGPQTVSLVITNGTCSATVTDNFIVDIDQAAFRGGPSDGATLARLDVCVVDNVSMFRSDGYDGAAMGIGPSPCVTDNIFFGSDGFDGAALGIMPSPCIINNVFIGGPSDGAVIASASTICPPVNVWSGGPFDGATLANDNVAINNGASSAEICPGGSITLTASALVGTPIAYAWSTGATTADITVSPVVTTRYTVTVTNTSCMPKSATFVVIVAEGVAVADAGPNRQSCGVQPVVLGTGARLNTTYSWSPATGLSNPNIAQPTATVATTTTFTLTATLNVSGCPAHTATSTVTVRVDNSVALAGPDAQICPGGNTLLSVTGSGSYEWYEMNSDGTIRVARLLTGYSRRMPITITNPNATTLTNHQVRVVVNTQALISAGKMRSDCADAAFTSDGMRVMDFWMESGCNSTSTIFWVKVPSIPASGSTTIYLHYTKPTQTTSLSNGDNTFIFFDDFNGALINATKWTEVDNASNFIQQSSGRLNFTGGPGAYGTIGIYSAVTIPRPFIFDVSFNRNSSQYAMLGLKNTGTGIAQSDLMYGTQVLYDGGGNRLQVFESGTNQGTFLNPLSSPTMHFRYRVRPTQGADYLHSYDNSTFSQYRTTNNNSDANFRIGFLARNMDAWFDNVRVRAFAANEPSHLVGTEESFTGDSDSTVRVFRTGRYMALSMNQNCPSNEVHMQVTDFAQTPLQYRTKANGNWTNVGIWEVYDVSCGDVTNDACWKDAATFGPCGGVPYPTSASSTILVRHNVLYDFTIPVGIDETTISSTGVLTIPSGVTLHLVDVSSSPIPADLQNNGRINITGTFNVVGDGMLVNDDASTVNYNANGNQTMWAGQYGNLIVSGSGIKSVGAVGTPVPGIGTLVRTNVRFEGAHIQLDNRNITLDDDATIANASFTNGYFITNSFGQVFKNNMGTGGTGSFIFPVGSSVSSYNRAVINNTGPTDRFGVRVTPQFDFDTAFPNDELQATTSVNRTWYITEQVPGGSNFSLQLYWNESHENAPGFARDASHIGRFDTGLGWLKQAVSLPAAGAGTNPDPYHQIAGNITSVGAFSVGSCSLLGLDYRTVANGNWTNPAIWEAWSFERQEWLPLNQINSGCGSLSYPNRSSLTIEVRHRVTYDFTIPIGVDQLKITRNSNFNGHLIIPSGVTMFLFNGPGNNFATPGAFSDPTIRNNRLDLENNGTLEITGRIVLDTSNVLYNNRGVGTNLLPVTQCYDRDGTPISCSPVPTDSVLWVNRTGSKVIYNSNTEQPLWNGSYDSLIVQANNVAIRKHVTGHATEARRYLRFNTARINLGQHNFKLYENAVIDNAGQNTGYMIANQRGYCHWVYSSGTNVSRFFPIGGVQYSPAEIRFAEVTTAGSMLGRLKEAKHAWLGRSIRRFWTFTIPAVGDSGTVMPAKPGDVYASTLSPLAFNSNLRYRIRLNYNNVDLPDTPDDGPLETAMVEQGCVWNFSEHISPVELAQNRWRLSPDQITNTLTVSTNWAEITNWSFSDFTLAPVNNPLPNRQLLLTGQWEDAGSKNAKLNVVLTPSQNVVKYELERAEPGKPFEVIQTFENFDEQDIISFIDTETGKIKANTFIYRVREVNSDGTMFFSNTVELTRSNSQFSRDYITVYPNPARVGMDLNVMIFLTKSANADVILYDALGKEIMHIMQPVTQGENLLQLPTSTVTQGAYFIKVVLPHDVFTQRVMIIH